MALIVEDGTGKTDAESYASVAEADLYHSNRGNTAWTALTTAAKEQALRKATDYIEEAYRMRWAGYRYTEAQALSWPRDEVRRRDFTYLNQAAFYPNNIVPDELVYATSIMALKSVSADLNADLSQSVVREKVDVLEVEYDPNSHQYVRYRAIDQLLSPFLTGSRSSISVGRV